MSFVCFLFHDFHSVLSHTAGIKAWITQVEPQPPKRWWLAPLFVLALPENVILLDNLFRETEWKPAIALCTPLRYTMDPKPSSHQGHDWGGGIRPCAAMPNSPAPLRWSSAQQTATLSLLYVFLRGQITPLSVPEDLVQKQIAIFPTNLPCSTAFLPQRIGSTQACSTPCNISSILLTSNIIFVSLQHKVVKNKQTKTRAQKQSQWKQVVDEKVSEVSNESSTTTLHEDFES